ncbi:MAG: hypothetical protein JRJ87_24410, partial [Deltaproteobacteria bacterium]|nr:hypothetical protein [Deltaproteobacteria bacterium]
SFGGLSDNCLVQVSGHVLEYIVLSPPSANLLVGETLQFAVTGHYSDGGTEDLTAPEFGTTYQSSDTQVLGIAANGLAWAVNPGGPLTVTARNSGFSDTATVTVNDLNPQPILSSIDPSQAIAGSGSLDLTANGSGFIANSVVTLDGQSLGTTYQSDSQLTALVPAGLTAEVGIFMLAVVNPPPGGGTSNSLPFWVVGIPALTTLSPDAGLQGTVVRVVFYGSGLLGCDVVPANSGITVSNLTYSDDGTQLAATFSIAATATPGPDLMTLTNLAGSTAASFTVIEDQPLEDLYIEGPGVIYLEGVQAYHNITIGTGAVVYGVGDQPLQFLATGDVMVLGEIHVSGSDGIDGYYDPADGGASGPGGGGGGGGGDGDSPQASSGGSGSPAGEGGGQAIGRGTLSGDGGGFGSGQGISGGCGQAGGGGGFGGDGGNGGGDIGPGTGGPGGTANSQGSLYNGGTGGGGGSACGPTCGGGGGGGGGVLVLAAVTGGDITIKGAIFANGGNGGNGHVGTGGGGGGSGGRITITSASGSIIIEDTLAARGGDGGPAYRSDGGGGGGGGRIIVDAGSGSVDDSSGFYDLFGGAGGISLDPQDPERGYDGLDGTVGVIDVRP